MFPNADEYFSTNESYLYEEDLDWWDSKEVNTFKFIITLPINLTKVTFVDNSIGVANFIDVDGKMHAKIFRPTFYFIISSNNESFYTKDGYLYTKDNVLVDDFVYYDA